MSDMLNVKGLSISFGGLKAVNNFAINIEKGQLYGLIGPNGAGKTTIFNLLTGVYKPDTGTILLDGQNLTGKSTTDINKAGIARTFQNIRLFKDLSVLDNVKAGLHNHHTYSTLEGILRLPRYYKVEKEMDEEAMELLKVFGLDGECDFKASNLPYGKQRKLEIARALATEPKLLLLDEPLAALDLKLRQDMQYELIRLKNELGITFIYVTHDQEEALTMSDTIVVMNQGYIQQMGTPEQIYNEPENAFVADFIGESNIVDGTMIHDELVEIFGAKFACVDKGFGNNKPVDVVIRPEDIDLVKPEDGTLQGVVTHLIFKGVHYEMEVTTPDGYEWLVHSTDMFPVGQKVGIHVDPFDIQIMNKPESEDEEAVGVNE